MALKELSSLEKFLGLKKPNKYSTQGDRKVIFAVYGIEWWGKCITNSYVQR